MDEEGPSGGRRRGVTGGSDEEEDNEDGVGRDRLAERLKQDAAEVRALAQALPTEYLGPFYMFASWGTPMAVKQSVVQS